MDIKFYDRKEKCYKIEKVAGKKYLNWTYSSPMGMRFLEALIKKKFFSKIYGFYCDSFLSKYKINKFIKSFNINMNDYKSCTYKNFNEFFVRKLSDKARPICIEKDTLISPCDGKILAYENIDIESIIQVKGINYSLYELIGNKEILQNYKDGTCLIFRLSPTDYHRFHFVDDGVCCPTTKIKGNYYSVNPVALKSINKLFCQNKREWCIFKSQNFNDILYVEVGATCVGSIIQTYTPNKPIKKGDEKGFFKFGGSTVILFLQKNSVKIHDDIIKQTKLGFESYVRMGDSIGNRK